MLDMATIRVLEVATFYFMFQLQPVGSVAIVQRNGSSCEPVTLTEKPPASDDFPDSEDEFSVSKRRKNAFHKYRNPVEYENIVYVLNSHIKLSAPKLFAVYLGKRMDLQLDLRLFWLVQAVCSSFTSLTPSYFSSSIELRLSHQIRGAEEHYHAGDRVSTVRGPHRRGSRESASVRWPSNSRTKPGAKL